MDLVTTNCQCGHAEHSHGRFFRGVWKGNCRAKGCKCQGYSPLCRGECDEDILDAPPRFAVTPADPDAAGVYDHLLTPEDIAAWEAWQAEADARLAAEDRGRISEEN